MVGEGRNEGGKDQEFPQSRLRSLENTKVGKMEENGKWGSE